MADEFLRSVSLVLPLSAHIALLFREYPLVERPAHAAAWGFTAIETWWPPSDVAPELAEEVAQHGLDVSLLNADGGDIEAGERGFLNDATRSDDAERAFTGALHLARAMRCTNIHVLLGRRCGRSHAAEIATACAQLRAWAPVAHAHGVTIVIEPINARDVPDYLAPTPRDIVRILDRIGSDSVQMLFDAYHVARGGLDPVAELVDVFDYVGHVQFADCPGRGAPGTGRLSLEAISDALQARGYRGMIGLEYSPGPSTMQSLAWSRHAGLRSL